MLFLPKHGCQNTWKAPLMHFSCKEIKDFKSISGQYLILPLRVQENNKNIGLLYQVTTVFTCGPPEKKHLPVLPWSALSTGWPFYSQGCWDTELDREPGHQQQDASSPVFSVCPSDAWKRSCPQLSLPWAFWSFFQSFSHSGWALHC